MVHHRRGLRRELIKQGHDDASASQLIDLLEEDFELTEIDEADRRMLRYAAKLTRAPGEMKQSDAEALRQFGFDDLAIHDICAVTGYYAFVNRIADGLGVELESD